MKNPQDHPAIEAREAVGRIFSEDLVQQAERMALAPWVHETPSLWRECAAMRPPAALLPSSEPAAREVGE